MKQNIEKNVKYILENIDDLDLSPIDKEYIDRIVKYLKFQVKYNQIYTNLIENEKLVKQIENTIKLLETQDEKLDKEIENTNDELTFKYEEYVPQENKAGIYAGFQAKVEKAKKKNYENKKEEAKKVFDLQKPEIELKLKNLQNQKDNITALREQINSSEFFINSILNDEFNISTFNNNYQSLVNECAKAILGKDINNDNSSLLFEYNEIEKKYEPIKENLKEYFEFARNPELAVELKDFYNSLNEIKENKNIAEIKEESSERKLSQREDIRAALYDKYEQKNVEDNIFDIIVLIDKLKEENEKIIVNNKTETNNEKNENQIKKFFGKFIKKELSNDEDEEEILEENENNEEGEINLILADIIDSYTKLKKITNFEEFPKASLIYEFYLNIAKTKLNNEDIKPNKDLLNSFNIDIEEDSLEEICLLYTFVSEYKFEEIHDIISQIIDNKVDEAQNIYSEDKKDLNDASAKEKNLIENLSEDAKKYHEKFGTEFSISTFNDLLVNNKSCSPLVASLVLEIIFGIEKVKTPDDINKFGIKFTDEDIKEYKDEITNTIIPNMENFLTNSMNFIIIKRS